MADILKGKVRGGIQAISLGTWDMMERMNPRLPFC